MTEYDVENCDVEDYNSLSEEELLERFLETEWRVTKNDNLALKHKDIFITIYSSRFGPGKYALTRDNKHFTKFDGRGIETIHEAKIVAFSIIGRSAVIDLLSRSSASESASNYTSEEVQEYHEEESNYPPDIIEPMSDDTPPWHVTGSAVNTNSDTPPSAMGEWKVKSVVGLVEAKSIFSLCFGPFVAGVVTITYRSEYRNGINNIEAISYVHSDGTKLLKLESKSGEHSLSDVFWDSITKIEAIAEQWLNSFVSNIKVGFRRENIDKFLNKKQDE